MTGRKDSRVPIGRKTTESEEVSREDEATIVENPTSGPSSAGAATGGPDEPQDPSSDASSGSSSGPIESDASDDPDLVSSVERQYSSVSTEMIRNALCIENDRAAEEILDICRRAGVPESRLLAYQDSRLDLLNELRELQEYKLVNNIAIAFHESLDGVVSTDTASLPEAEMQALHRRFFIENYASSDMGYDRIQEEIRTNASRWRSRRNELERGFDSDTHSSKWDAAEAQLHSEIVEHLARHNANVTKFIESHPKYDEIEAFVAEHGSGRILENTFIAACADIKEHNYTKLPVRDPVLGSLDDREDNLEHRADVVSDEAQNILCARISLKTAECELNEAEDQLGNQMQNFVAHGAIDEDFVENIIVRNEDETAIDYEVLETSLQVAGRGLLASTTTTAAVPMPAWEDFESSLPDLPEPPEEPEASASPDEHNRHAIALQQYGIVQAQRTEIRGEDRMNYQTALATRQHEAAVAQTQRADLRDAVTSLIHYQGICDRRRETIQEREQDLESAVANARKTVNREFNNHYDKIEGKYGKELSDYNSKQRTKLTRILGAAAAIALAAASGVGLYALNVTVDADFTETNQKIEKVDETASAARSAATTAAGVANEAMARSKDYQRALTGLVDSKD